MTARIIDGTALAGRLRDRIADAVAKLAPRGLVLGLAVVLVGDDPASRVYVGSKKRATLAAGMRSIDHLLPGTTSERDLLDLVGRLNADEDVDGILVQLPLPAGIDAQKILLAIDPAKDVDGFHPLNAGRLATGMAALVPCTPRGCILLAKTVLPDLAGLEAVVLGRSNIVGKPVAQLLLAESATVTIAHSRTRDLPSVCRRADLLVAAVGRPDMVRGDWIKPGAVVIDVGINRMPDPAAGASKTGAGKTRLVGDVHFEEARQIASAITPVPGGVGPMTIACLLANALTAACARRGLPVPTLDL